MIDGRTLENLLREWIQFKKWEWGIRLITAGATILICLKFFDNLIRLLTGGV